MIVSRIVRRSALRQATVAVFFGGPAVIAACNAGLDLDVPSNRTVDGGVSEASADVTVVDAPVEHDGGNVLDAEVVDAVPDVLITQVAKPTFTPLPGTFTSAPNVTIATTTPGATIHYTDDGTIPTEASPVLESAVFRVCTTTTLRVIAIAPGLDPSPIAAGTFTIAKIGAPSAPVAFAPVAGSFNGPVDVALSTTTSPATVCFTLNGTAPTCDPDVSSLPGGCIVQDGGFQVRGCGTGSSKYDAGSPIHLELSPDGGDVTVKACTCVGLIPSDVTTAHYTFAP